MILYSIIPPEIVFLNSEESVSKKTVEMAWEGQKVEATLLENNRYVIDRVISTSPKAFLNPKLQPGTIIEGKLHSQL